MKIDISELSQEELADLEKQLNERRQQEILNHLSEAKRLLAQATLNDDLAKALQSLLKDALQSPQAAELLREATPQEKTRTPRRSPEARRAVFLTILSKIGKGSTFTSSSFRQHCSDPTHLGTYVAADNPLTYFSTELKEAEDDGRVTREGELSKTVYTVAK